MKKIEWPKRKLVFLFSIVLIYILFGLIIFYLVKIDFIPQLVPRVISPEKTEYDLNESDRYLVERLDLAQNFFNEYMREENGHINLYLRVNGESEKEDNYTNSEAVSYYLLWNAFSSNKVDFDKELDFMEENMIHPEGGYMMWKLDNNDKVVDDGGNVATDADLRTIRALIIADKTWDDERYEKLIENLTYSLERVGLTSDNYLSPYGGYSGRFWKSEEVWLSYIDFNAFADIANYEGQPWREVYYNMRSAILKAQKDNGLYSTQLEENRMYSNRLDNDKYSINTLWIMVKNAESNDKELKDSARKALSFYKEKYEQDGLIYTEYNFDGSPASGSDSPWVYALVGRAAVMVEDEEFSDLMIQELLMKQVNQKDSEFYGAFVEGEPGDEIIGQFTMQESILTLQEYIRYKSVLANV